MWLGQVIDGITQREQEEKEKQAGEQHATKVQLLQARSECDRYDRGVGCGGEVGREGL